MMLAGDFLSSKLFPLKPTDSVQVALELMNELNVAYLPVVEDGQVRGYLSVGNLLDQKPKSKKIGSLLPHTPAPIIQEKQHLFDVIRLFANLPSTVVAVVDSEEKFLGIISAKELIRQMAEFSGFLEAGSILTLNIGLQDYSLSEIARIVEYNNAKILSVHLQALPDSRRILVHLKLNTSDLKSLVATFERYNYQVTASYYNEDDQGALKDRFNLLMRYLDM
ncbi:MAG: CBS domain-containing protein [Bacteroidota bacterium]|nr:CBS domain-containing protein [Bacteroidota bacterium]MDX5430411.1 CBS domain-containing protein [Bacteroidota bacterium]MDX5469170.1 CBS domain-containing protein [Bacteroidota bacterium]